MRADAQLPAIFSNLALQIRDGEVAAAHETSSFKLLVFQNRAVSWNDDDGRSDSVLLCLIGIPSLPIPCVPIFRECLREHFNPFLTDSVAVSIVW